MYRNTPLLEQRIGRQDVLLKLECDQPTGSFKLRGMSRLCEHAARTGANAVVSSSGGNAGLAAAYAARSLKLACRVVVPETTPKLTVRRLEALGASVQQQGADWNAADQVARDLCGSTGAFYVHPFDHPELWRGHATVIEECASAFSELGGAPDAVVVAVGGGGLLCGVLSGMHAASWAQVPLVAVETHGAASLHAAIAAGRPAELPAIETIAITMGARQVSDRAYQWTQEHPVQSVLVSDRQALAGCRRFADDHRRLVEPACGAALSAVYDGLVDARRPLVIVCGGAGVNLEMLEGWSAKLAETATDSSAAAAPPAASG
ncbi:MAG: pyridoxal-phosphate dependent enzyme [Pseudomonadota bacterium]